MARNVSSRFSLDEGFDQQIENLHSNNNDRRNNENVNSTNNTNNTNSTASAVQKEDIKDTESDKNTNSANSENDAIATDNITSSANTANDANVSKTPSAPFDPAVEAEFIAKSCLYDESKTKRITIQFNRDIYDYIKRESRVRGLSINNFVRMIILSYMSVPGNKHYVDID